MLYFDEAGYTGPDLTNKSQPFFTLASIRMSDEEIVNLKDDIHYKEGAREFHFSKMYSNYKGREMLNRIFNHPLMDTSHVLLSFAYKRFCIYANIVNMLIEPLYYNNGRNIYEGAENLILANCLYSFAALHSNKDLISKYESNFIQMVRTPSVSTIDDFYRTTDKLRYDKNTNEDFYDMLTVIPPTIKYINEVLSNQKFYIDLTIPLFSVSVQEWYKKTKVKDDVLFDSSEPFSTNKEFLENLRDMKVPETEVGYGKNKHVYPLPVGNLGIAKSHEKFGLQLADIYASALNFILSPRRDKFEKYKEEIRKITIFHDVKLNIAPATKEFIEERMKETADIDPVDFLCGTWNRS